MNRNTVGTFFNIMEKVATDTNLSETRGNFFNIDENGKEINKKPGPVIAEKGSTNFHVLTSGEKSGNITVTVSCNAAGQFISPVLTFKYVYETHESGDALPPGSDVHMNRKSSYISTKLFIMWIKQHFLKHKFSAKVILLLDGHRSRCRLSHAACLTCCYEDAGVNQKQVFRRVRKTEKSDY